MDGDWLYEWKKYKCYFLDLYLLFKGYRSRGYFVCVGSGVGF